MCGLAGIIGKITDIEKYNLIKMISVQAHRGPDAHRIVKTRNSLLGFSRLKIIDFNDRAMQPMLSEDKRHVLVFNGEIYNYKFLKKIIETYNNFILQGAQNIFHLWQWINMELFLRVFLDKNQRKYNILNNIEYISLDNE